MKLDWAEIRLGRAARTISGTGFPYQHQGRSSGDFPFIKVSDLKDPINSYGITGARNYISEETRGTLGAKIVPKGSIVFPKIGAALLGNHRALTLRPCLLDNNLMAVVPLSGDPRFWYYALSSVDLGELSPGGPLPYVNDSQVRDIRLWLPPEPDQEHIADFLDAETSRVDQLSGLRRKQLDLINERAAARVLSAVQGSCIPGDRKDSGLGWLGEVPQSWRIAAVSHFFEVELGKMLNQDRVSGVNLRPYLRVANVQWDEVTVDELAYMDFPPVEQQRYRLEAGDLLVNEGGSWPGRAAIWDGKIPEMYYQKALHRIRPRGKERTRWLYYCLVAAEHMKVFVVQGNTSTITHLTREQLRPQRFPFPDHETQDVLIAELDQAHERDATLKAKLRYQLSLLAERRQALITAAITGQFDVSTASGRGIED